LRRTGVADPVNQRGIGAGHGDGQGPASLTFAGAADWLAGWCGVWVWGVGAPARAWQVMGADGPAWWCGAVIGLRPQII
jgi:hypothetical protein